MIPLKAKKGFILFGRENYGPGQVITKPIPVIPSGHESCDVCHIIRPRSDLEYVHSYDAGSDIYLCRSHIP